jgi:hypothetical protein
MATAPKRGIKVVKMGYKMEMGRRKWECGIKGLGAPERGDRKMGKD